MTSSNVERAALVALLRSREVSWPDIARRVWDRASTRRLPDPATDLLGLTPHHGAGPSPAGTAPGSVVAVHLTADRLPRTVGRDRGSAWALHEDEELIVHRVGRHP